MLVFWNAFQETASRRNQKKINHSLIYFISFLSQKTVLKKMPKKIELYPQKKQTQRITEYDTSGNLKETNDIQNVQMSNKWKLNSIV